MEKKETLDARTLAVAKKIKELRIKAGYSSGETFAFEQGLPRVQYWRMETGVNMKFETLLKVLDIHKISLKEFFSDIEQSI